jgi:hypothetical protein
VETPPLRPFPNTVVVTNHTNNLCKTTLRFHIFAHLEEGLTQTEFMLLPTSGQKELHDLH